ncbi:hypothetical protein J6590_012615, partial [Homalodisca vitripennis]
MSYSINPEIQYHHLAVFSVFLGVLFVPHAKRCVSKRTSSSAEQRAQGASATGVKRQPLYLVIAPRVRK